MSLSPSVFGYNKSVRRETDITTDLLLKALPKAAITFWKDTYGDLTDRNEAWTILIAHIEDEDLASIVSTRNTNGVIIRVSTVGRQAASRKVGNVYVLECRKEYVHITGWDDVITRLTGDSNLPDEICAGRTPRDLWDYFGSPPVDHLIALCILCQGFLAAENPRKQGLPEDLVRVIEDRKKERWENDKINWWSVINIASVRDEWGGPLPEPMCKFLEKSPASLTASDVEMALIAVTSRLKDQ